MLIKEISILSKSEAECHEDIIPRTKIAWRLKTPAIYDNYTYCIDSNNDFIECNVQSSIGIRPALLIKFSNNPAISSQIDLFNRKWTVLSNIFNGTLILCDDVICCRRYDFGNNKWETSELKTWLKEWLQEQKRSFGYV